MACYIDKDCKCGLIKCQLCERKAKVKVKHKRKQNITFREGTPIYCCYTPRGFGISVGFPN